MMVRVRRSSIVTFAGRRIPGRLLTRNIAYAIPMRRDPQDFGPTGPIMLRHRASFT